MGEPSAKILRRFPDETLDGEGDNIDRLSALPEPVLLHILSGLEFTEAATTSVLSKTWRDLFLQLPKIQLTFYIDEDPSEYPRLFHIFTLFANRVLRERNPEAPITFLKVSVRNYSERLEQDYRSLLMSAAAAVSTYKVTEFDLRLGTFDLLTEPSLMVLPPAIFMSKTLTSLRLTLSAGWDVPENVWLPNLMVVHFVPYTLMHENSTQRFLDGCPSLQNLMLLIGVIRNYETKVKTLCMSSSSLKTLMVGWDQIEETEMSTTVKSESLERLTLSVRGGHKVNVDAPNLKFFSISGHVDELNMIQSFPSIDEADLDVQYKFQASDEDDFYSPSQNAYTFLGALQNVRLLNISQVTMKVLCDSTSEMPTFINMYKIRLIPTYCYDFPRSRINQVLFKLFEKCPNLQVLYFDAVKVFDDSHKHVFDDNYYFGRWDFKSIFPISMVQNLKKLEIFNFGGWEKDYKMVEFFMKNGQSLEIVSLRKASKAYSWRPQQQERILSFMTCSEDCKIIFREHFDFINSP